MSLLYHVLGRFLLVISAFFVLILFPQMVWSESGQVIIQTISDNMTKVLLSQPLSDFKLTTAKILEIDGRERNLTYGICSNVLWPKTREKYGTPLKQGPSEFEEGEDWCWNFARTTGYIPESITYTFEFANCWINGHDCGYFTFLGWHFDFKFPNPEINVSNQNVQVVIDPQGLITITYEIGKLLVGIPQSLVRWRIWYSEEEYENLEPPDYPNAWHYCCKYVPWSNGEEWHPFYQHIELHNIKVEIVLGYAVDYAFSANEPQLNVYLHHFKLSPLPSTQVNYELDDVWQDGSIGQEYVEDPLQNTINKLLVTKLNQVIDQINSHNKYLPTSVKGLGASVPLKNSKAFIDINFWPYVNKFWELLSETQPNLLENLRIILDSDADQLSDWDEITKFMTNPKSVDTDEDGIGDMQEVTDGTNPLVDEDKDKDGIKNEQDNCMWHKNPDQEDHDSDKLGDLCDNDDDNDGLPDVEEISHNTNPFQWDTDGDGMGDKEEVKQYLTNPLKKDSDEDGLTDFIEIEVGTDPLQPTPDADQDGISNFDDNCPVHANPDQMNGDEDSLGNVCDKDDDNDGYEDYADNCSEISNPNQADEDNDKIGDLCDMCAQDKVNDPDKDNICGLVDNCPSISNPDQIDANQDGKGDSCQCVKNNNPDPYCSGAVFCLGPVANTPIVGCLKIDNDYLTANIAECIHIYDMTIKVGTQEQQIIPFSLEKFSDYDNAPIAVTINAKKNLPSWLIGETFTFVPPPLYEQEAAKPWKYWWTEGAKYVGEADITFDAMGTIYAREPIPGTEYYCKVDYVTPCDPNNPWCNVDLFADDDQDGLVNANDNCVAVKNSDQEDVDQDGIGDLCDALIDSDNDGIPNIQDNCSMISNIDQLDSDEDGLGNVCDPEDDYDGILDQDDNCPTITNFDQSDDDADGIGDLCDELPCLAKKVFINNTCQSDQDEDQVVDNDDNCSEVANKNQSDYPDQDGVGTACDPDSDNDGILDDGDGSGMIGDQQCVNGATQNCDDNCRFKSNSDQKDPNGNGVGQACDKTENPTLQFLDLLKKGKLKIQNRFKIDPKKFKQEKYWKPKWFP